MVTLLSVLLIITQIYFFPFEMNSNSIISNPVTASTSLIDESSHRREIISTPFNGTATSVYLNIQNNSTFYYPGQHQYFKFVCPSRRYVSFNYSGPNANLKIFYSNFFANTDYLVSVDNLNNAIDCYLFEEDTEYIIDFSSTSFSSPTSFSFQLTTVTMNSLTNHTKYALHQVIDTNSNVGYHYETVYLDVSNTTYTATNSYLNSYSSSTSYVDIIDSTHYFYDPTKHFFTDNRRVVVDTSYMEYSSIAVGYSWGCSNTVSSGFVDGITTRFSGTFISPNVVLSCAHFNYFNQVLKVNNVNYYCAGMNYRIKFYPGYNDYSSNDYYGTYYVDEIYTSVSYILQYYENNDDYDFDCADYDWSICITSVETPGSRTHSYMGVTGFSIINQQSVFSYAQCAGYPMMQSDPTDINLYHYTMWTSYPLSNDVSVSGGRIESTDVVISGGNSGGPLYFKNTALYNGQPITTVHIIGICSGYIAPENSSTYIGAFYRNTALIVNIARLFMDD